MTWSRDAAGQVRGRMPRDAVRFAVLAVTAGYTIQETADWLRLHRQMDMNPGIAAAWDVSKPTEYILERAGLNHRVFSPNHALFQFNQGVVAFRKSDLEGAEKFFRKAMDLDPQFVPARHNLGVTLYRAGKYDEASEAFLMATGMAKAGPDDFYNRGATLFRLGDKLGAARAFRRVLELNPRDPDAGSWIEKADPEGRTKPAPAKSKSKKKRGRRK
jgi:tetratricopeptide (TPR) repeat protein